jgi:hypothetical protein
MIFSIAQLTSDQLHSIRDLEEQTGHCIVALRSLPGEPAEISDEELSRLRGVEEDLGLTLVAVNEG